MKSCAGLGKIEAFNVFSMTEGADVGPVKTMLRVCALSPVLSPVPFTPFTQQYT